MKFVAVLKGQCVLILPNKPPSIMTKGDVFLIGNIEYTIASGPNVLPLDGDEFYAESSQDTVRIGEDCDTIMLGGGVEFPEDVANFFLEALPDFIRVDRDAPGAIAVERGLSLLDAEIDGDRPARELVIARLTELLLVEAIRAYIASDVVEHASWIGALGHPQISKSLKLMHGNVERQWTVRELAGAVGMSRSAFATRFKQLVGQPPLDYLTQWRMILARRFLSYGHLDSVSVAERVGYSSQSAFSHAFKRVLGHSPKAKRNHRPD